MLVTSIFSFFSHCFQKAVFSPFPTMSSTQSRTNLTISAIYYLSSANAFNLDQIEIVVILVA